MLIVYESLSEIEQKNYVANGLNITLEEVSKAEIQYTRNLGGVVTMILSSIKELFDWNTEQDERITELENENNKFKDCLTSSTTFDEYKSCVNPDFYSLVA